MFMAKSKLKNISADETIKRKKEAALKLYVSECQVDNVLVHFPVQYLARVEYTHKPLTLKFKATLIVFTTFLWDETKA